MVMKILRKKGVMKKILWFVAVIIILSFGLFSNAYRMSNRTAGGHTYAGKIFGKKISFEDFERYYQQTEIQAMIQYDQNFRKIKEFLNLSAETWDRLILLHEADRRRIHISNQAVVEAVKNSQTGSGRKFFERDGQFDPLLYNDILRYVFKVTARDFEEGMRNSLKYIELYKQVTEGITVSDNEIHEAYRQKNEKIQLSYVLVSADQFKNQITLDENAAQDYYKLHKDEFAVPPMINVEYIILDYPENASDDDKKAVKTKVENIVKELIANNKDLAAAAKKFDVELKTSGFFSMEQPNLQIGSSYETLQALFQFDVGHVTQPVETPNGYKIIRMKEKKTGYVPEYAQAKDKVIEAWKLSEGKKLAKQKAEENLTAVKNAFKDVRRPDFAATAKNLKLEIQQTPVFSRNEYLPNLGISKEFQAVAFSLNEDNRLADNVVETLRGYAILYLDSKQPIDEKDYEKQKQEIADGLLTEKRNAAFSEFLTQLRLKANLQDNVSELMNRRGQ
jgi:peptidyl-prolyl cis-trans isomerase D